MSAVAASPQPFLSPELRVVEGQLTPQRDSVHQGDRTSWVMWLGFTTLLVAMHLYDLLLAFLSW